MSLDATDYRQNSVRLHPLRRRGLGIWQGAERYLALPAKLRPWLTNPGSLTARLSAFGRQPIRVRILRQGWGRPYLSEARALGLAPDKICLVREVVLHGPRQEPWVFARSLFPAPSLTGRLRHLRHLDTRPLGGYLFRHAQLGRSALQLAHLPAVGLIPDHLQEGRPVWGRRSVFTLYGKKLLVSEIFLPAFERALDRTE